MVPPTSHKVSRVSWYFGYCLSLFVFPYGAFTLSGRLSQYRSGNSEYNLLQSLTLQCTHRSLGSFPFARRYSGNRCFFLFLRLLRCFSSPGSLPYVMYWRMDDRGLLCRVSPFGHLRVNGYLLLTAAFRSLSRPSSALSAKASSLRPYQLNLYSLPTVETVPDSRSAYCRPTICPSDIACGDGTYLLNLFTLSHAVDQQVIYCCKTALTDSYNHLYSVTNDGLLLSRIC